MRLPALSLLLIASFVLSACVASFSSQQPALPWTTGFWFWQGSSAAAVSSGDPLDVLFVHVGTIRKETGPFVVPRTRAATEEWYANGELPDKLPAAKEYWLVFRYERQGVPDLQVAPMIAGEVSRLIAAANKR